MDINKIHRDMRALFFLDFARFKNNIKDAIHHPGKLAGLIIQYVLQFVWLLPAILFRGNKPRTTWNLGPDIIGAIVSALLTLIFLSGLNRASTKYAPGQYSTADVNFLFPSPVNQRTVYAWSLIREIGSSFYLVLLSIVYLPFFAAMMGIQLDLSKLIYTIVTIILVSILISGLNFFIYSLSHRFGTGKIIKAFVRLATLTLLGYTGWEMLTLDNIWEGLLSALNGPVFASIPVIGWAKTLIISPLTASSPLALLLILSAVTVLIIALSIYFAVDYYEEAAGVAEWTKAVSSGNIEAIEATVNEENPRRKVRKVDIAWNLSGPWVFAWKQAVASKRASGFITLGWEHIFLAVVGIVVGIVTSGNFDSVTGFAIVYAFVYASIIGAIPIGLQYELRKQYIYMLPGRPLHKILAVNIISVIRAVNRGIVLILPVWILSGLSTDQALSTFLFVTSVDIMSLFSAVTVNILLPFYDLKNVLHSYLRMGVQALSMLPAILPAVIIGAVTKNTILAFYVFAAGSLLALALLLYISEKLFNRLEMR